MLTRQLPTPTLPLNLGPSNRTPGIHLSRIIKAIAMESKILHPQYAEDLSLEEIPSKSDAWWEALEPYARLRMSMGLAWEAWYIPRLPGVDDHPGEMMLQNIYGTVDGLSMDAIWYNGLHVHEVKLTYKSVNTVGALEREWMWLAQAKGYAKMVGCRVVIFHILFVCGDYSRPIRPDLQVWRIEFTEAEIEASWDLYIEYVEYKKRLEMADDDGGEA